MPIPAKVTDLEARWRPLSDAEKTVASALLEDAWNMLQNRVPALVDQMSELVVVGEVKRVICAAVLRVMRNPDGKRQESLDDHAWTLDNAVAAGFLYFTDDELAAFTPGGRRGAFTIDMLGGWAGSA